MLAAQINKYGSSDVIEINNVPKPKAKKGEVLVKVFASSINPFDIALRQGILREKIILTFPHTLGGDLSGVITEVGEDVDNFIVGNKVYGSGNVLSGATGAFAEFAAVPAHLLAKMPNNIDFKESAAVVLTGASAVQAIIENIKLQPDQKILIHGGAGGIGTIAIQIAKMVGAFVATTTTGDGINYVKKLGADLVVDYKSEQFDEIIQDYDAVYDTVGGEVFEKSFKVLKKGRDAKEAGSAGSSVRGILVSMVTRDDKNLAEQYSVKSAYQSTKVSGEHLDILRGFIESGHVKPHIDKTFSFDRIRDAFEEKEKGNVLGKIVIEINK